MKRTRLHRPYNEDGSCAFPARGVPGVYLIYRITSLYGEELRYVGYGGKDVYKALYRHFQEWNDRQADRGERSDRITYRLRDEYRVRVIYVTTTRQAMELEKALILRYRPKDNPDKLELYELTPDGRAMTEEAKDAPFVENMEAPF